MEGGWKFESALTTHVKTLWEDLAEDVREEFAKQGITTYAQFLADVSSGDRAVSLMYRGELAAMIWSGYVQSGRRMRSLGCVISKSMADRFPFEIGRRAKELLDEYMMEEPDREHGVFVAIPTTSERLNKFASRLAGLRITGIDHVLGVPHFIYRWEGSNA